MPGGYDIMAGILQREEGRLIAELADIRAKFTHSGNKGAMAEHEFREFLRRYMPGDTRVGHGEVFDIDGRLARQTDVVVANKYHVALQADWEQPQKFTIETVQCGAEVKSSLTGLDSLRDCFEKAKAFKGLLETSGPSILMPMGDDDRRFLLRRPYFAFAFESRLTLQTIYGALTAWNEELREVERPVLDGLFTLDRGGLTHMGTGKGQLFIEGEDGERLTGYVGFTRDGGVLTRLLVWMYGVMPMTIPFRHPVFPYLQPSGESGTLWLNDQGRVERRPPRPPAAATDGTAETEGM